jgi:DNA-binding CsgD family transcriptional regulator
VNELERGRQHYAARAWARAFEALSLADRAEPLAADDLEKLAWSAGLSGHEPEHRKHLERLYQACVEASEGTRAGRAAFWLGFRLAILGETASASGWLSRAQRLADDAGTDCVVTGYLLIAEVRRRFVAADYEGAYAAAVRAAEIGERCGEREIVVFARSLQGRIRVRQGMVDAGLPLLDESMLCVTQGETSPAITGIMYCAALSTCNSIYALDRSREWTSALARWCEQQPELVPFTSECMVHRAEVLRLDGAWPEALDEARRAGEHVGARVDFGAAGEAAYQQGEIHRLRGALPEAEESFRKANENGRDPHPGLALLRLAQNRADQAVTSIRRVAKAHTEPLARARFLPAMVEILLAAGDVDGANEACVDLENTAHQFKTDLLGAIAAQARGDVELARGDAEAAVRSSKHAFGVWQQAGAPYEAAKARVTMARACRALGDEDGAALELAAARQVFERLGASPDVAAIDALGSRGPSRRDHPLSARELEVLRLVAAGKTNKDIARELHLSGKTVDRHMSNIFAKLNVPTRTAAAAYAYDHGLV